MKALFQPANPDEIEMTLTITMPLGAWRRLALQIASEYPGWQFVGIIRELILFADKHFEQPGESERS